MRDAEIADVDESAARDDRVATRLYGRSGCRADAAPMVGRQDVGGRRSTRRWRRWPPRTARELDPERLYLLGPGTTTAADPARSSGLHGTLLGVDVVRDGRLVARDLGEAELLELLADEPATLVVGVVGGQGSLFGRGNQQLSPAVLRRVGVRQHQSSRPPTSCCAV